MPWFADWCSIALGIDGELRTLAVEHVDPEKVALALELRAPLPAGPAAPRRLPPGLPHRSRELTPEITDEMIDEAVPDPEQRRLIRELNIYSAMAVPLKVGDRVLGVVTWVAGEQGRRFGPKDLAFGEDLARRAAVAIDNSQLHTERREMAVRLQRAVLPGRAAARGRLGGRRALLPCRPHRRRRRLLRRDQARRRRIALFVGDVMGRGVHAAAAMAQMRSAVRAFIAVDPTPGR